MVHTPAPTGALLQTPLTRGVIGVVARSLQYCTLRNEAFWWWPLAGRSVPVGYGPFDG